MTEFRHKFHTGQVIHHKRFQYRGVIVGVDLTFQLSDEWYDEVAKSVYRPDIYRQAAEELIAEGHMSADEFPAFDSEDGYREPQSEFIDGVTFDGTQPNAYLEQFEIGLKGAEKI